VPHRELGLCIGLHSDRLLAIDPVAARAFNAAFGPGKDQRALEFSQPAQDGDQQLAVCCRGIAPSVRKRLERCAGRGHLVENVACCPPNTLALGNAASGHALPRLLTEAAHGSLKPPPTGPLQRVLLHLSHSMTLARLLDTTPSSLLTTAACGGLRSTPDCRPRRQKAPGTPPFGFRISRAECYHVRRSSGHLRNVG
jgi:hypothetical protein